MSRLSTEPRVTAVLRSISPDRRTRYFEPLSTLVWLCSTILSFINSCSSSSLEIRCCKSPDEESPVDCSGGGKVAEAKDEDEGDEAGIDPDGTGDVSGRAS